MARPFPLLRNTASAVLRNRGIPVSLATRSRLSSTLMSSVTGKGCCNCGMQLAVYYKLYITSLPGNNQSVHPAAWYRSANVVII